MNNPNNSPEEYYNVPVPVQDYGDGAIPQIPQMSDRADLIEKIKPEAVVEVIRMRLLGREFIAGEWVEVEALKHRRLTEIGAWEIANLMLGVSSISISISKLNDREIKERTFRIAKSAQRMLLSNWKEYGIINTAQLYYVHEIIFSNTLAVLKQADGASIQELLKGTIRGSIGDDSAYRESTTKRIGRMLGLA
jgi:hypothetical protein|tara:strand:- start:1640 stop:2218 length:579 start_codon:yes stop_codon:yes gene_type:complete